MNNILIDTCFWYALYNPGDQYYQKAQKMIDYLEFGNIIIPYPTLHETLNTKFVSRKDWSVSFNNILNRDSTIFIDDKDYKAKALKLTLDNAITAKRPMSLVDIIIRLILDDVNVKTDAIITFNIKDFIDVCVSKNIELIDK
ncbi:hypothetical protein [Dysgonomonas sp.]